MKPTEEGNGGTDDRASGQRRSLEDDPLYSRPCLPGCFICHTRSGTDVGRIPEPQDAEPKVVRA